MTTTRVKGFCAMIGGVSILKLAEDSVFVSRDGIVKTTKNDLAEANKKNYMLLHTNTRHIVIAQEKKIKAQYFQKKNKRYIHRYNNK